ncbi:MAG: MBOAT family O-acyltransferase [Alsobacter sp.]
MQFNSLSYIFVFLPVTVAAWALLRRTPYANLVILVASLYFYASDKIWYPLPLFAVAMLDFYVARSVYSSQDERRRFLLTAMSIVVNLAFLAYFKYAMWLTSGLSSWGEQFGFMIPVIHAVLPPAISFYTFQSMSYTIDVYRREFKPYNSVVDYLSFVTFFPHLVAGPIMRARDLLPQLARNRDFPRLETIAQGLFMILFGLWLKVVVADNFGGVVEDVMKLAANDRQLKPGMGLVLAYAFAVQIYADFSGYTTIARGSAKLFNVELMRNFLAPYFSVNPSEFWSRWHISLSTWLRDYLYIPLGGNRKGTFNTYRNLMITMLLGGLWHGAGGWFVVWGLWHGLLLIAYRFVPVDRWLLRHGRLGRVAATVLFFNLVCIGWIFFRCDSQTIRPVVESILALPAVFHDDAARGDLLAYGRFFMVIGLPFFIFDALTRRREAEIGDQFPSFPLWGKVALSLFLFYEILVLGRRQGSEFIYFAF